NNSSTSERSDTSEPHILSRYRWRASPEGISRASRKMVLAWSGALGIGRSLDLKNSARRAGLRPPEKSPFFTESGLSLRPDQHRGTIRAAARSWHKSSFVRHFATASRELPLPAAS